MTTTTDTPNAACAYCGRPNDSATGAEGTHPRPGDVGICWGCLGVNIYTDELGSQRQATVGELEEIRAHPDFAATLLAVVGQRTPQEAAESVWGE